MKFKKEHPIYLDTVLQPKICNSGVYEYVHSLADFDKLYWKNEFDTKIKMNIGVVIIWITMLPPLFKKRRTFESTGLNSW